MPTVYNATIWWPPGNAPQQGTITFTNPSTNASTRAPDRYTRVAERDEEAMTTQEDVLLTGEAPPTPAPRPVNTNPPVIPKVGALMREIDTGNMLYFDGWSNDGQVRAHRVDQKRVNNYGADAVEALTAPVYGRTYRAEDGQRMCLFNARNEGYADGTLVTRIEGWDSIQAYYHVANRNRALYMSVNYLALLAPPLNPATESAEDKMARLERELDDMKERVHHRMVAEGVARDWCATFDPILDSIGLEKRRRPANVSGTLAFKGIPINPANGRSAEDEFRRRPFAYLNEQNTTVETCESALDAQTQYLS